MKNIKGCPFCGTRPNCRFDAEKALYILQCDICLEHNRNIQCFNEDLNAAIDNWNARASLNNTDIFNLSNFGYLILDTLEVLDCELFAHGELLSKKFNLKITKQEEFDSPSFCFNNKIIKVTGEIEQIGIDLPYNYTQKQIDVLIHILNRENSALHFSKFYLYDINTNKVELFNNITDVLNYLLTLKGRINHG